MYSMLSKWIDVYISIYWYPILTDDKQENRKQENKWTKGLLALGSGLKGWLGLGKTPLPSLLGIAVE